jgi:uncharacterized protein YaiL (DUF2058 family)
MPESTATRSLSPTTPTVRVVPGALPPATLAKSQIKRKRKAGTTGQSKSDIDRPESSVGANKEDTPKHEAVEAIEKEVLERVEVEKKLVEAHKEHEGDKEEKKYASPVIEFLHKRIKAHTKKIVSFFSCCNPAVRYPSQHRFASHLATDTYLLVETRVRFE